MGEYLKKGSQVYIEGQLRTRKWQDKETGKDRYSTEIRADVMQMLGGRAGSGEPKSGESAPRGESAAKPVPKKPGGKIEDMEDDIPF